MRKPVFGVSKPGTTLIRLYSRRRWLEAGKFRIWEVEELPYILSETEALISYTVTCQLIWAFVFAYAKSRFSHDMAQLTHCTAISKFTGDNKINQ